jgi:hypothetical protein
MKKIFLNALRVVNDYRRAYMLSNMVYYGLFIGGVIAMALVPASLKESMIQQLGVFLTTGTYAPVTEAYDSGFVLLAILLTFVVNLIIGRFFSITLPSVVIPFSGPLMYMPIAFTMGAVVSLALGTRTIIDINLFLLAALELQSSVIAILGAYIQGKALLFPKSVGLATHQQGFWLGIKESLYLYALIIAVLAIAAVHESFLFFVVLPMSK